MEDVLAVYMRPHDPERPLVCLDETSKQLVAETRTPIPMKPGSPARHDYEYERHGVANLFMMFAPLEGWRYVKVTDRHTAIDYAHVLRDISDPHFADAKIITLLQDNLNIHAKSSLYEAFPRPRLAASSTASNGSTRPSMAPGSIWQNPNSPSSLPSASIGASQTTKPSAARSAPGSNTATSATPRPTGASPPMTPASSSSTYTPCFR